jgi:outer membrane immunogenic protein
VSTSGVLTNIANVNAFGAIDAGGGFEWKTHANWSLWVEYDHIFRRNDTLTYSGVGGASSFRELVRRDLDKVLFGINYRFGSPVVARY